MSATIVSDLLDWFDRTKREMPWRLSRDPYAIWVSEVMLQQTRVDTVRPYWERFMERFPSVRALAEAPLDDLYKVWEGLGYYRRARNLQTAARQIVDRHGGQLPADASALEALAGVGPYTAGAVASMAFGLAKPALDGNAVRVASRLYEVGGEVSSARVRAELEARIRALLAEGPASGRPGELNQALMELGATVCSPQSPRCEACPVGGECLARQGGDPARLPQRRKKAPAPFAEIAVALCVEGQSVLVARRPDGGLLAGMMGFPAAVLEAGESPAEGSVRALAAVGLRGEPIGPFRSYPFVFSSLRSVHRVILVRRSGGEPAGEAFFADRRALDALALPAAMAPIRDALTDARDWRVLSARTGKPAPAVAGDLVLSEAAVG